MPGVNDEFFPFLRMTGPKDANIADAPIGERAFRSWLLLFGLIPFDYDDITLVEIVPERSFHERSTMLTQRRWEHWRDLEPLPGGGTRVTDRIDFEPKLPGGDALRPVFRLVFRYRHRRLRKRFGARAASH